MNCRQESEEIEEKRQILEIKMQKVREDIIKKMKLWEINEIR